MFLSGNMRLSSNLRRCEKHSTNQPLEDHESRSALLRHPHLPLIQNQPTNQPTSQPASQPASQANKQTNKQTTTTTTTTTATTKKTRTRNKQQLQPRQQTISDFVFTEGVETSKQKEKQQQHLSEGPRTKPWLCFA